MSRLSTLIKESVAAKRESVESTVRLPKELYSFVEGLAEHLAISKQEMLVHLIEAGAEQAEEELKLNEVSEQDDATFHVLNTNKRHSLDDHERMVDEGIAAAFYAPWKFNINRIKKNDTVFLYENGVGIIAYGKGTGETLTADHHGKKDERHYQKLKEFKVLSKPLPANEIKKILNRNVIFLRTMSGMPDGQKIMDRLKAE